MIGQCTAQYNVLPVAEVLSCGVCLPCGLKAFRFRATLDTLTNQLHSPGKACAFALFSPCPQSTPAKIAEIRRSMCDVVLPQASILHGTTVGTYCNQSTEEVAAWKVAPLGQIGKAATQAQLPTPPSRGSSSSGGAGGSGRARGGVVSGAPLASAANSSYAPAAAVLSTPHKIKIDARTPGMSSVRSFLAQLGLLQYKKVIVKSLGVGSVPDLGWVEQSDLQLIGMSEDEQKTFMRALQAPELQREKYDIDSTKRLFPGDGAVMSVLRQIRLLRARERLIGKGPGQLRIKTLNQMKAVTEEQLKAAAFPPITRRRFLAAMLSLH